MRHSLAQKDLVSVGPNQAHQQLRKVKILVPRYPQSACRSHGYTPEHRPGELRLGNLDLSKIRADGEEESMDLNSAPPRVQISAREAARLMSIKHRRDYHPVSWSRCRNDG